MKKIFYILFFICSFLKAQHIPFNPHPKEEVAFYNQVVSNGGATTVAQRMAVSNYVADLLNYSLFSISYAIYPMVGASINSCKVNLITPNTFSITFVNTVAGDFTSSGWLPNGTSSYGRTGLVPSTTMSFNNTAIHYGSNSVVGPTTARDMGANNSTIARYILLIRNGSDFMTTTCYDVTTSPVFTNTLTSGVFTSSRTSGTNLQMYVNGNSLGTDITSSALGSLPTVEFFIGAQNVNGVASNFSTKRCINAALTQGFTPTQSMNYYLATNKMNKLLQR